MFFGADLAQKNSNVLAELSFIMFLAFLSFNRK